MVSSWALLVLLQIVSVVFGGAEYACTFTDSNGNYYDLSPLSSCDGTGYTVPASDDGPFVVNVCNTVGQCGGNAGVCQGGSWNAGSAANATFSTVSSGTGVVLKYANGASSNTCPGGGSRTSILNFVCDASATTPVFNFTGESPTCSYNFQVRSKYACPVQKGPQAVTCKVFVYLVPHTHDDVGWLQTIDGYYESSVKYILDTVVSSLAANPNRKFIYVEQAYFWRWWTDNNTSDEQRATFMKIYQNGQLEFVIGGWVMQDEACTTYGADIDQMTLGHQFILNTFGARPTKGWQIDPFGASSVTPTLNKLSGFNAHLIDRVTNKQLLEEEKRIEFTWVGSPSLGESAQIFTSILNGQQNAYCDWFNSFSFDNNPVTTENVAQYAATFVAMANQYSANILSNVLLAEWGCDFQFTNATADFASMDILVEYLQSIEDQTGIIVQYATLSEYYDALFAVTNITYPTVKYTDFFPLNEGNYWTGYYTSRTQLKGYTRRGEATAHAVEPLYALAKLLGSFSEGSLAEAFNNIVALRLANADAQHHDGVTGTSVPNVVLMYETDLLNGISLALDVAATVLSGFISENKQYNALNSTYEDLLNLQSNEVLPVLVYNPLGWSRTEILALPFNFPGASVTDSNNNTVVSQVNPNYINADNSTAKYMLYFEVITPPLGYSTYFVSGLQTQDENVKVYKVSPDADTVLTNGYYTVTISSSTGRISSISNNVSKVDFEGGQNLLYYTSQGSGAYVFDPKGPASPVSSAAPATTVSQGPILTEAYQVFPTGNSGPSGSWAKQSIRLYQSPTTPNLQTVNGFVEFSYDIGVLPSATEVVTSFNTNINNNRTLYNDDNGFEFLPRNVQPGVPIQGNYLPTIYATYIQDSNTQLSVLSERTHGCSSQANGEIELMIHRNPNMGDGFGPSLTDLTIVYPTNRVIVDTPAASFAQMRTEPIRLNFPLVPFFGAPTTSYSDWVGQYKTTDQFLTNSAIPLNINFLSLYSLTDTNSTTSIFRLTHLFAVGEDPEYSQDVTIDVASIWNYDFTVVSFSETTLTGNQVIVNNAPTTVTLSCKQIRTFIIELAYNN